MSIQLPWLSPENLLFPHPSTALKDPDGLLAVGGDLSVQRLVAAYQEGIFPWFGDNEPILWWSPDPRCQLKPSEVHISKSLKKSIRKHHFSLSFDGEFDKVIQHCSREDSDEGTWITDEMRDAYIDLHQAGIAHSVEVKLDGELVGGLYGLAMGRCFFGESMFTRYSNASKIAFSALCRQLERWNYELVDCQVENKHLLSLGASSIPRHQFLSILAEQRGKMPSQTDWIFDADILSSL